LGAFLFPEGSKSALCQWFGFRVSPKGGHFHLTVAWFQLYPRRGVVSALPWLSAFFFPEGSKSALCQWFGFPVLPEG
ncbi:MAG: hypothetical protein KAI28_06905, partial [Sphingomonadales bacterium]|nr:hypothetical protein [Sphingomonadales bacterium]